MERENIGTDKSLDKTLEGDVDYFGWQNPAEAMNNLDEEFIRESIQEMKQLSPESTKVLGEEEKKYLALLRKKDQISFSHSFEVFNIGQKKIKIFGGDLQNEGVADEDFLKACVLHDIGKLKTPDCVLKSTLGEDEFESKFFEARKQNSAFIDSRLRELNLFSDAQTVNDLSDEEIKNLRLNYIDLIPLSSLFVDEPNKLQELKNYGFDPAVTSFFDVVRPHEKNSHDIIEKMQTLENKEIVAEIAGAHHGYTSGKQEKFPVAKQVLRLTVLTTELLHLADMYGAMRQKRYYNKGPLSEIGSLYKLIEKTRTGKFHEWLVKKWIKDSMEGLAQENYDFGQENQEEYKAVCAFISAGANTS